MWWPRVAQFETRQMEAEALKQLHAERESVVAATAGPSRRRATGRVAPGSVQGPGYSDAPCAASADC